MVKLITVTVQWLPIFPLGSTDNVSIYIHSMSHFRIQEPHAG